MTPHGSPRRGGGRRGILAVVVLAMLAAAAWGGWSWRLHRAEAARPPRVDAASSLAPGITYQRRVIAVPRPVVLHLVRIDLATPGLRFLLTPGDVRPPEGMEITAMTTSEFVRRHGVQVAVNASFFYPFHSEVWGAYPDAGDPVNVVGEAISDGRAYSPPAAELGWSVLCVDGIGGVQILAQPQCPAGTLQGVSGHPLILSGGQPASPWRPALDLPYPRTVAGLQQDRVLWLVAVDGKQPAYSEGLGLAELVPVLQSLGIDRALNLDGGGSTTLAVRDPDGGVRLLNSPSHRQRPMLERPVANHLGVRVDAAGTTGAPSHPPTRGGASSSDASPAAGLLPRRLPEARPR